MNQFEFLISFAAIILALAVCDLAISLNRLAQAGKKVAWDWLAPLAAAVAFLKILTQWWSWYGAAPYAGNLTFGMFLAVLSATVLLFLMAASALPDEIGEKGVKLREYYAGVSRRFWLLFAGHWLAATASVIWISLGAMDARIDYWSPAYLIVPVALLLAYTKNRPLHFICLLGFLLLYLAQSFTRTLGH